MKEGMNHMKIYNNLNSDGLVFIGILDRMVLAQISAIAAVQFNDDPNIPDILGGLTPTEYAMKKLCSTVDKAFSEFATSVELCGMLIKFDGEHVAIEYDLEKISDEDDTFTETYFRLLYGLIRSKASAYGEVAFSFDDILEIVAKKTDDNHDIIVEYHALNKLNAIARYSQNNNSSMRHYLTQDLQ